MSTTLRWTFISFLIGLLFTRPGLAAQSQEERSLSELRNTVVNLLQTLVQQGVFTREQAQTMVKTAQDKAAADATAADQQEKAEAGSVRVPYVPEVVKEEIRKELADQLAPEVARHVVSQAQAEGWGIPGALPDWIRRVSWGGDVRVRSEGDVFARGNSPTAYLNFNAVNSAGGIFRAANAAFLNTTVDRYYLLARLRLDLEAQLDSGWSAGARLSTGTLTNPDSTNQVLGQYGARYQTNIDKAYVRWAAQSARQKLTLWGGKFGNPYLSSDLIWDADVTLEGVALDYRVNVGREASAPRRLFATLGVFPVQEIALSTSDKWLYAGQVGLDFHTHGGSGVRLGVAYYDYKHLVGRQNALESNLLDYTAPLYLQKGNTLFDIRNTQDLTQNLFALAADYREADAIMVADWNVTPAYRFSLYADYVKNLGYNAAQVAARVGADVPPRVKGYQGELSFGTANSNRAGAWRAFFGYRYLQRDAVLDAFTDQDYHLGGTDARGYIAGAYVNFTDRVWAQVRYLSFDAIDGPPLGVDVWQVEINARF
jgi:hypothetical protein